MDGQWLIRATGQGEWVSDDEQVRGKFSIAVDIDSASVKIHYDPDYPIDGDEAHLLRYSLKYVHGGFAILVCFVCEGLQHEGLVELDGNGKLEGQYKGPEGASGYYTGTTSPQLRPHGVKPPTPDKMVKKHLANEPNSLDWKAPACLNSGRVVVVGVGGPSRSGKSTLAKALAKAYKERGIVVSVVRQDQFNVCAGMYHLPGGGTEAMYETPCSLKWDQLAEALTKAIESVKSKPGAPPGLVIVEGFLLYWVAELNRVFDVRLFLRASRDEVLRRRQAATKLHPSFLEHVFWPSHLAYGQPEAPFHEYKIPDGQKGYPVPSDLLESAMRDVESHIPALAHP